MSALNVKEIKRTGLEEIESLTAQINELLHLRVSKAAELHEIGVTYKTLGKAMDTSTMTARRHVTMHISSATAV